MRDAFETASREASGWRKHVLAAYYLLTANFSLTVAGFGVVLMGIGVALIPIEAALGLDTTNIPILAGMFGIWGATLVLLGLLAYGFFWTTAKYADLSAS